MIRVVFILLSAGFLSAEFNGEPNSLSALFYIAGTFSLIPVIGKLISNRISLFGLGLILCSLAYYGFIFLAHNGQFEHLIFSCAIMVLSVMCIIAGLDLKERKEENK